MSDITKCLGLNCPLADSCYRFTATIGEFHQSYFIDDTVPYNVEKNECEYYWQQLISPKVNYKEIDNEAI